MHSTLLSPQGPWSTSGTRKGFLSVSVMQAGVTCTNLSNYTAWKWQLEKKNHDLAPELAAYTLTRSFSYASHQGGRDSLTPNCHIHTEGIFLAIKILGKCRNVCHMYRGQEQADMLIHLETKASSRNVLRSPPICVKLLFAHQNS